jgi:hypothetical protein
MTSTVSEIILLFFVCVPESDCAMITPRYTVINCLGRERIVAALNVKNPMPHVEKTPVVTVWKRWVLYHNAKKTRGQLTMTGNGGEARDHCDLQPGLANAIMELTVHANAADILTGKPPSRTTLARLA